MKCICFGLDGEKCSALMITQITEDNINEYSRFDDLKATVDKTKAKAYFEGIEGQALPTFWMNIKRANLLQGFIIKGGIEVVA